MEVQGHEREQKIENLFEEIITENSPNLVKAIDKRVQAVQRVPNRVNPKRTTPRHNRIKMPKVKDKERILPAASEKQLVIYKGAPMDCQLISQQKLYRPEEFGKKYSN